MKFTNKAVLGMIMKITVFSQKIGMNTLQRNSRKNHDILQIFFSKPILII